MIAPSGSEASEVAELVRRKTGLIFSGSRRLTFETAVGVRMRRRFAGDAGAYLTRLDADPDELQGLVAEITVGETYFFREPRQLDLIAGHILPELMRRKSPGGPVRVWSAGCASGEEAYTLAMVAAESNTAAQVEVVGTDISQRALERCRRATYGKWSMRAVDHLRRMRFFDGNGDRYCPKAAIRSRVRFLELNLAADGAHDSGNGLAALDLILCRNVLIYLDPATVERVAMRLLDALAHGGWLLLGAADPMIGHLPGCETIVTTAGIAYRKVGRHARTPAVDQHFASALDAEPPLPVSMTTRRFSSSRPLSRVPASRQPELPGDVGEVVELVRRLADRGEMARASRLAALAAERHPESPEIVILHSMMRSELGDHAGAIRLARTGLYLDRDLIIGHLALATAAYRSGDTDTAVRCYRNAEQLLSRLDPADVVPASGGIAVLELAGMVGGKLALLGTAMVKS